MRGKALIALASIIDLFLPLMALLPFHEAGGSDEPGLLEMVASRTAPRIGMSVTRLLNSSRLRNMSVRGRELPP